MSPYFLDGTPALEIIIRNPIADKSFPSEGEVIAILDTGFEGFLLIPKSVFEELSFNQFDVTRRKLMLANGLFTQSAGTFGEVIIPSLNVQLDGFVETIEGVEEIVIGTELMKNLKLILDYCIGRVNVKNCK